MLRFSLKALLATTLIVAIVLAMIIYWHTPRLEQDIVARIRADFPAEQHGEVRQILLAYDLDGARMHRCLLHVAKRSLTALKPAAADDYRDVILAAEYETTDLGWERVRAYDRTFEDSNDAPVAQEL